MSHLFVKERRQPAPVTGKQARPLGGTRDRHSADVSKAADAPWKFFCGPGISNFDLTLTNLLRISELKSFKFRLEGFNAFNHAQFYGAGSLHREVNGISATQLSVAPIAALCVRPPPPDRRPRPLPNPPRRLRVSH